jgi:ATP-binding cassette, subfamily F, member 3
MSAKQNTKNTNMNTTSETKKKTNVKDQTKTSKTSKITKITKTKATETAKTNKQSSQVPEQSLQSSVKTLPEIDYCNLASIVTTFPSWAQEQYDIRVKNLKNITKSVNIEGFTLKTPFGDKVLLQDCDLIIEPNRRSVLFGRNSTGKTLLFSNISKGLIKNFPKHINVHHCKELESHELGETVLNTVLHSNPYLNALLEAEKQITKRLEDLLPKDSTIVLDKTALDTKRKLQDNLAYIKSAITSIGGYTAKEKIIKMLNVLGFDDLAMQKLCSALSGGLKMRVALCIAFFVEADLLLLDEPTNHLDFPSVLWLEGRLRAYKGAFLLVSHDRELLNNVCTSVLLIENKQIKYYVMPFAEFEKTKAKEDKKYAEDVDKFLAKNRTADPSTMAGRQVHDKKKWLESYTQSQIAMSGKFTFPEPIKLEPDDKPIIEMKDVRFSYDTTVEKPVFVFDDPISLTVSKNTRMAIIGPNSSGKSTCIKLLTKKNIPVSGTVEHHPNFILAYFGQHSTAELDPEETPMEFMTRSFPEEKSGLLRAHLAKTGVHSGVEDGRLKGLSFSQKSCVIFSKLTYKSPHLLIMDEPTNFLDLESVDSLISATNKYKGALLLVSHNRDFLKRCANQYLAIMPGSFKIYDSLKVAERSTYSFISELEEGKKVDSGTLSESLAKNAGNTLMSSKTVNTNPNVIGISKSSNNVSSISVVAKQDKKEPIKDTIKDTTKVNNLPLTFSVGEKCLCKWTDGEYYDVTIKYITGDKHTVLYSAYGNTQVVSASSLKKLPDKKVVARK